MTPPLSLFAYRVHVLAVEPAFSRMSQLVSATVAVAATRPVVDCGARKNFSTHSKSSCQKRSRFTVTATKSMMPPKQDVAVRVISGLRGTSGRKKKDVVSKFE